MPLLIGTFCDLHSASGLPSLRPTGTSRLWHVTAIRVPCSCAPVRVGNGAGSHRQY